MVHGPRGLKGTEKGENTVQQHRTENSENNWTENSENDCRLSCPLKVMAAIPSIKAANAVVGDVIEQVTAVSYLQKVATQPTPPIRGRGGKRHGGANAGGGALPALGSAFTVCIRTTAAWLRSLMAFFLEA